MSSGQGEIGVGKGSKPRLLLDENLRDPALRSELEKLGFRCVSVGDNGAPGLKAKDCDIVAYAARRNVVLVSADTQHLPRWHAAWLALRKRHAGMVALHRDDLGRDARRMARAVAEVVGRYAPVRMENVFLAGDRYVGEVLTLESGSPLLRLLLALRQRRTRAEGGSP